eukprot:m.233971 g.233971  ORF g.233971 m.233971 type:complete len:491 (+) comp15745_c0_seq4:513-1985(+)
MSRMFGVGCCRKLIPLKTRKNFGRNEKRKDFGLTRDNAEKVVGPLSDKVAEQACKFIQALVFNVVQVSPMLSGDLFTGVEYELLMFMCREQVDDERMLRIGKAQCVEHVIRNFKMDTPNVRCGIDGTPGMAVLMTCLTHPTYAQWIQPLFAKLTDHEDKNDVDSDDEDDEDQGNEEDDGEQMIQNLIKDPSLLTISEGDAIDVSRAIELAFLAHSPEKRTAVIDYFCKNVPKELVGCLVQYLAEPHDADSVDEDDPLYEKMQNYKHTPFLWSFHSETDLEQTIKANTDNNDEADESDLHIFIADHIKRVRRPLSHEVGMYPISGEDKPDSAGRACVTFLGSELEVASQSALDTLDENFAEAVASDEHETDLITVSVMLISGFDRLPRFREAVKELFLKKHDNILEVDLRLTIPTPDFGRMRTANLLINELLLHSTSRRRLRLIPEWRKEWWPVVLFQRIVLRRSRGIQNGFGESIVIFFTVMKIQSPRNS